MFVRNLQTCTFLTFVYSTLDGGITWTNYFQPPNWKSSRMTAVPGTNAFISTSVSQNQLFTGSSISYDAGKTWAQIDQTGSKAACRFFDAETGYAGGLHVSGHPVFGTRGIFKSAIVFQLPSVTKNNTTASISTEEISNNLVKVYPSPARDVVNINLPVALMNNVNTISLLSADGKLIETRRTKASNLVQFNVSKLPPGIYILRIQSNMQIFNKAVTITR